MIAVILGQARMMTAQPYHLWRKVAAVVLVEFHFRSVSSLLYFKVCVDLKLTKKKGSDMI